MQVFARSSRLLAAAATGAVLMLTACTPTPAAPSAPTSAPPSLSKTPTPTPEPYAGPVVFVGDELDLFLPTPDQIISIIPDATGVTSSAARLEQISDGGGAAAKPAICEALYVEQSLGSVGARSMAWETPGDTNGSPVRLLVLQFPDEEHAQTRMDQLLDAAEQCASFTTDGEVTFDTTIADETDNAQAFAGTLIDDSLDWRAFYGFASAGNVLVQLVQPIGGEQQYDAEAAATLLRDNAEQAHGALVDKLTETSPTETTPPVADADAPWGGWQISADGVGPVLLGEKVETAIDAVPNATVVKPDYPGGEWTLTSADESGTLLVLPQEGGDAVVRVTVGLTQIYGDTAVPDGSTLPAVGDVRVGSAASEAIAAHPGGTTVSVVSSGEEWYAVADRDGRLVRFRTDRVATDPQAKIIGISVDDATLWKVVNFSE